MFRDLGFGLNTYTLKPENLSLTFSFGLSWIPAGVYPVAERGRNDKATNPAKRGVIPVKTGIQGRKILNIFG
jgi:hypothetical protein